jgi:di/tricarboxylate transporter
MDKLEIKICFLNYFFIHYFFEYYKINYNFITIFYFIIGSAMTFTGNPQNIIIAGFLSELMSGGLFFLLMIPPAVVSWFITCYYINRIR